MRTTHLLSHGWHVKQLETDQPDIARLTQEAAAPDDDWLAAPHFPAQVHDVLLAHGRIPDPHFGKNAADCAWVGDTDWAYAATFPTPGETAPGGPAFLRFNGLDTLGAAYLNGILVGRFDDMFRQYVVDVREHLAPHGQTNVLFLVFSAPLRFVREVEQPPEHVGKISKHKYLRKAANDFNAYLGARPHFIKVGPYRAIVLDLPDPAGWLEDVWVRTELAPRHETATLNVRAEIGGQAEPGAQLAWTLTDGNGQEVGRGTADNDIFTISVERPQLWWPWTHGTPHLYRLVVRLVGSDGSERDSHIVNVGIRDIAPVLSDPATGEKRFAFTLNGQRVFLQGANWVPVEGSTHCWDAERARTLLDIAQQGRMNTLRVWGGGYEPPADFYDECDRRGILVWQDFFFEYGMHPTNHTPAFDANCRAEAEGMVKRLRSHPCLLLWCGGNENYMGWNYDIGGEPTIGRDLFEHILPDACARLDPACLYHPSSPFGGPEANWPLDGDWHDYTWRGYSHRCAVPAFVSEGGRASTMSLASLRRYLSAEDFWPDAYDPAVRRGGTPAWPPLWQYRSVDGSWVKVGAIEEFCDPKTADELVRVLGTAHGEYLQRTVERYRRGVPDGSPDSGERHCGGYLVWRLSDAWPINYYSVLDYSLEPKIAFYYLRRAFAPVLVSFEQTPDRLAVWVTNDSPELVSGLLVVRRVRFDGIVPGELTAEVALAPGESRRCLDTVDLGPVLLQGELLHARFGDSVEATHLLLGERYLRLPPAALRVRPVPGGLEVTTDGFARQVTLTGEGEPPLVFEDNYFDLMPGHTRVINLLNAGPRRSLIVEALNAGSEQIHTS